MNLFNRMTENDVGRSKLMKALLIAVASFVLVVAPVSAQQAPTPTPSTDNSWIHDLGQLVQGIGTSGTLSLIISAGFVLLLYRTFKPMLDAAREDRDELRRQREEREKDREEREKDRQERGLITQRMSSVLKDNSDNQQIDSEQRGQQTKVLQGMLDMLAEVKATATSTRDGLDNPLPRFQSVLEEQYAQNKKLASQVNEHTTSEVNDLETKVNEAIRTLTSLRVDVTVMSETIRQIPTLAAIRGVLGETLGSMDERIDEAIQQFLAVKKGDTNRNLNPQIAIDAENARNRASGGDDSTKAS